MAACLIGSVLSFPGTGAWGQQGDNGALDQPFVGNILIDMVPEEVMLVDPVVSQAIYMADGWEKWVRALVRHPRWPVLVPFAAQARFTCIRDTMARSVNCWEWRVITIDGAPYATGGLNQ